MANKDFAESVYPATPMPPDWVTSGARAINGLDLVGLRSPVNTIGNTLLNGITTITPTIRYLSLRSWIIRQYALARQPDTLKSFRNYAGRIEAAVAFGNLLIDDSTRGLIGNETASKVIERGDDPIELKALVKILASTIYTGPSEQLKISFGSESRVPGLTEERGMPLAEKIDQIIGETEFVQKIKTDPDYNIVKRDSLLELGKAFRISKPEEDEGALILEALLPSQPRPDEINRIASYGILLEIAQREKSLDEDAIFKISIMPSHYLPGYYQKWIDGWLYYLVRCAIAVVHEKALEAVIDQMAPENDQNKPWYRNEFIAMLMSYEEQMKDYLKALNLFRNSENLLDLSLHKLLNRIQEVTKPRTDRTIPRWDGFTEMDVMSLALGGGIESLALLPVSWILVKERSRLGPLAADGLATLLSYQGSGRLGLDQVILPALEDMLRRNITIRGAIAELTLRTVDQHLRIAWSRMAREPDRDVSLLSTDGDIWYFKKAFRGGRTASRMTQTIGWLNQLALVNEKGCTTKGRHYLNRINSILEKETGI